MRRLLRDIAAGQELGDVTTLRDPTVMEQLQEKVVTQAVGRGLVGSRQRPHSNLGPGTWDLGPNPGTWDLGPGTSAL